mgnify:CR=1 FL=1|jgi:hypothetical protein
MAQRAWLKRKKKLGERGASPAAARKLSSCISKATSVLNAAAPKPARLMAAATTLERALLKAGEGAAMAPHGWHGEWY